MKTKLFLGLVGCGVLVGAHAAEVITTGAPSSSGAGHSMAPALSAAGHVVFVSHANNLVTNDNLLPFLDVFVRHSATTTLISVDRSGRGGGNGDSSHASISTNGQYVLFASEASNLVSDDTNGESDVFLRDLQSGTTTLVSVNTNGTAAGAPGFGSRRPIMTPDGRFVVFESTANDIVPGDTNSFRDIFIRDMQTGVTRLVTVGSQPPFLKPTSASVSTNGRRVAFVSPTANVVPEVGPTVSGFYEVYVRDMLNETTHWASSNLTAYFNAEANGYKCRNSVISGNGAKVAFKAVGPDGVAVHVLVHDIDTGSTSAVGTNSHPDTRPAFSGDGRWLAFEENESILLRDLVYGTNLLVRPSGPTNGFSFRPVMTPDARYVAFISSAATIPPNNRFMIWVRDVGSGSTQLVAPGRGDMHAVLPAIDAYGQVTFDTDAPDVVGGDNNKSSDVFRENVGSATAVFSRRHDLRPARTGLQSAGINRYSVSADGKRLAFASFDDPRFPADTNGAIDAFVYGAQSGQLIPQNGPEGAFAFGGSWVEPHLSANGQYVLNRREYLKSFQDRTMDLMWRKVDDDSTAVVVATNLLAGGISSNGTVIAYGGLTVHDMIANTNRVFRNIGFNAARCQFSPDEQWVMFSDSPSSTVWAMDVNAANPFSARPIVVSRDTNGLGIPASNGNFDRTGRYYFFDALNFVPRRVYRFDFQTTNSTLICTNCTQSSINTDGTLMAAVRQTSIGADVILFNLTNGTETLISKDYAGTGGGNAFSSFPLLSPDGRYAVFTSLASNLVPNDANGLSDIFVHDRVQNTTVLLTRAYDGARSGNGQSTQPVMAKNGRTVFFQSFAGDLAEGDYNERRDIFVVKLGVGDSDNDGMDDDWEVAQFGNLNRDGSGDQDGDGQTDLQEYLAGTNPTNDASILRVLTVTPLGGGSTTVVWSAVVGRDYIVQFKDSLDASWANASSVIEADTTSMSFAHNSSSAQRYYRVIAVQ